MVSAIHHQAYLRVLTILFLVLSVVTIGLISSYVYLSVQIKNDAPLPNPFPSFHPAAYPMIQQAYMPQLTAQGAAVLNTSAHVFLYTKNAGVRFSPASTTKMITALTALDYFKPTDILTVQRNYVEGSGLQLKKGERFRFIDLLYAMFLPSANDAAYTIADNYPGGITAFVAKMNEKVASFNLEDTHYNDPAGLDDDNDYTTPHDLAIIGSMVMQQPLLTKIVDTQVARIISLGGIAYPLQNLNKLLGFDGVNGIKTGTTDEAGEVLVTSDRQGEHHYILVVMKSDDRFGDTEKLLHLLTHNITYLSIQPVMH